MHPATSFVIRIIVLTSALGALSLEAQSSSQPTVQIVNSASYAPGMPGGGVGLLLQGQTQPSIGVVNSASYAGGMPTGGALATLFVTGASSSQVPGPKPGVYQPSPSVPLPTSLQGWQVLVNGAYAPILAVVIPEPPATTVQINIQVPLERNATIGEINIGAGGPLSLCNGYYPTGTVIVFPLSAPLGNAGIGGFFQDANGYLTAQHASDHSPVTLQNPAHAAEQIIAFADDFFSVWPPPPLGVPIPLNVTYGAIPGTGPDGELVNQYEALYLQKYVANPLCPNPESPCIYGYTTTPYVPIDAELLAPGMIGVEEIVFHVPANQQPGDWALFFNTGSCSDGRGAPCPGQPPGSNSSPYALLPVR